jgi:hypothetical protein
VHHKVRDGKGGVNFEAHAVDFSNKKVKKNFAWKDHSENKTRK